MSPPIGRELAWRVFVEVESCCAKGKRNSRAMPPVTFTPCLTSYQFNRLQWRINPGELILQGIGSAAPQNNGRKGLQNPTRQFKNGRRGSECTLILFLPIICKTRVDMLIMAEEDWWLPSLFHLRYKMQQQQVLHEFLIFTSIRGHSMPSVDLLEIPPVWAFLDPHATTIKLVNDVAVFSLIPIQPIALIRSYCTNGN